MRPEAPPSAPPPSLVIRAMLRGLALRCPDCGQGRMFRTRLGLSLAPACPACGYVFEFHPGDWSGSVMIAQMLMGLAAIPTWIVLMLLTPLDFTWSVIWTLVVVVGLWALTYRNIKGMWFGWLCAARGLGADPPGAVEGPGRAAGPDE